MPWMRLIEMRWRLRLAGGATLECRIHRLSAHEYEISMGSADHVAYAEITTELGSARYFADVLKRAMLVEHRGSAEIAATESFELSTHRDPLRD